MRPEVAKVVAIFADTLTKCVESGHGHMTIEVTPRGIRIIGGPGHLVELGPRK